MNGPFGLGATITGGSSLAAHLFKNHNALLRGGSADLRATALDIAAAGLCGGDPYAGTRREVRREGSRLHIGTMMFDLDEIKNIYIVGGGKASLSIAAALEECLQERLSGGIIVVKRGETRQLDRLEVLQAGHPLPDEDSIRGARKILEWAALAGRHDLVLAPITGGISSLATLPPEPVSLTDIRRLNDLLLRSGAPIREVNMVRRHVCLLKGGRFITHILPARTITLTLDTAPDDMTWPDLSLADRSTPNEAIELLQAYDLWQRTPSVIRDHLLLKSGLQTQKAFKQRRNAETDIVYVGNRVDVCEAAAACAREKGFATMILSAEIDGEAREAGICLAGIAREIAKRNRPLVPPCALISAGETTVTVGDSPGCGGPNQEFVIGFASVLKKICRYACISLDTDGTDGPTEFAGGIVDNETVDVAAGLSLDIGDFLRRHNSTELLSRLGATIETGHTGTNLQNLRITVIGLSLPP